jgi:uracil-DNA glycosylase
VAFDEGERAVPTLVGSFHPSRQNTNTGRLTSEMLTSVFRTARRLAETETARPT